MIPKTYVCSKCNRELQFTSKYFPIHKRCKWGLDTICRDCTCKSARKANSTERNKLRLEILTRYSLNGKFGCQCCGESRIEFLTLDHINGGGNKERKKYPATMLFRKLRRESYPSGYRTLCYNCNCSYGKYGYCPHNSIC